MNAILNDWRGILKEAWDPIMLVKWESLAALLISAFIAVTITPAGGWLIAMALNVFVVRLSVEKRISAYNYEGWTLARKRNRIGVEFLTMCQDGVKAARKNLGSNPSASESFLIVLDKRLQEVLNGIKLAENGASQEEVLKSFDEGRLE